MPNTDPSHLNRGSIGVCYTLVVKNCGVVSCIDDEAGRELSDLISRPIIGICFFSVMGLVQGRLCKIILYCLGILYAVVHLCI